MDFKLKYCSRKLSAELQLQRPQLNLVISVVVVDKAAAARFESGPHSYKELRKDSIAPLQR